MKKLLLSFMLLITFSATAAPKVKYETKCINGYLFAVVIVKDSFSKNVGVSMVQIFETGSLASGKYPPQPKICY